MRTSPLFFVSLVAGDLNDVDFGDPDNPVDYNSTNHDLIESTGGDAWNDGMETDAPDSSSGGSDINPNDVHGSLDDFSDGTTAAPPATLIYTCGGTANQLGFCQFPFTTLAGNEYTHSCADKVEDNPDYTVDRPWCFTAASEWGFCDCSATFDMTYVTAQNLRNSSLRDIQVQVSLDYPGTIWCSLTVNETRLPTLTQVMNAGNTVTYAGGAAAMSDDMVLRSMDAHVLFSATPDFMKAHPYLACQASVPGLLTQPDAIGMMLGSNTVKPPSPGDPNDDGSNAGPVLLTETSGAAIYSLIIAMILGSFIGVKVALEKRAALLAFSPIANKEGVAN